MRGRTNNAQRADAQRAVDTPTYSEQDAESVVRPLASAPAASEVDRAPAGNTTKRRVLVVDDNRDAAESMAALLEMLGHPVRAVHSAAEALQAASEAVPKVMLIDIGMPKMNGHDLARTVRSQLWGSDILLIALTGLGQDIDRIQAKDAGFDFHLIKPADPDELQRLLAAERAA